MLITPTKEFLKVFKETEGALSVAESIAIMNIAALVFDSFNALTCVEFGVYKGKSAMSAVYSFYAGAFLLVEPEFKGANWQREVCKKVSSINQTIAVVPSDKTSLEVIPTLNDIDYCFLDSGSHGDGLPMQEVKLLEDRISKNGVICFHDYKNQFTEIEGAYNYLLSTGKYEEIPIDWDAIFEYVNANDLENGNNSWHLYPELNHPPNFVGALKKIK